MVEFSGGGAEGAGGGSAGSGAQVSTGGGSATPPVAPSSGNADSSAPAGDLGQQSAASGAAETPAQKAMRRLKVNDQEVELSEEDFERYASMGFSAHDRWNHAAKIREQNQLFLKTLKENPRVILGNPRLGIDVKKLAHEILMEDIENEMLSPAEREARDLKNRLKTFEDRDAAQKQKDDDERIAEEDRQYQQTQDKAIRDTLGSSKLPLTMFTYNSCVQYMGAAMKAGIVNVTPQDVMRFVERDYRQSLDKLYQLPDDQMLDFIGQANIDRLQKAVLARAGRKQQDPNPPQQQKMREDIAAKPGEKGMDLEEWRAWAKEQLARDRTAVAN